MMANDKHEAIIKNQLANVDGNYFVCKYCINQKRYIWRVISNMLMIFNIIYLTMTKAQQEINVEDVAELMTDDETDEDDMHVNFQNEIGIDVDNLMTDDESEAESQLNEENLMTDDESEENSELIDANMLTDDKDF